MKFRSLLLFPIFLFVVGAVFSQEEEETSLLDMLSEEEEVTTFVQASFKTTIVVNLASIENTHAGVLDFKIMHRFGYINTGFYDFFGLDQATTRLGLVYGITDRIEVGLGRSTLNKNWDGHLKWRILWQSTGAKKNLLSISFYTNASYRSLRYPEDDLRTIYPSSNFYYTFQFLFARKFSERLTIQLIPSLVHRNLIETPDEKNDVYSLGISGRIKLTNRMSLNLEYFYSFPNQLAEQFVNPFSLGLDLETGGHVFQLLFTNATGMVPDAVITETTGKWIQGDIRFGFNISRVFTIVDMNKRKVEKEKKKDA
jgi:hypothetical protein